MLRGWLSRHDLLPRTRNEREVFHLKRWHRGGESNHRIVKADVPAAQTPALAPAAPAPTPAPAPAAPTPAPQLPLPKQESPKEQANKQAAVTTTPTPSASKAPVPQNASEASEASKAEGQKSSGPVIKDSSKDANDTTKDSFRNLLVP